MGGGSTVSKRHAWTSGKEVKDTSKDETKEKKRNNGLQE